MRVATETPRHDRSGGTHSHAGLLPWFTVAWMAAVLAYYYRRLWRLLAAGFGEWKLPDVGQGLLHSGVPFAADAAASAGSAMSTVLLLVMALVGAGRVFDRWLMPAGLTVWERLVVRFANGAGAWSLAFLTLAWLGLYRPSVLRVSLSLAAVGAAGWAVARGRAAVRPAIGECRRGFLRAPVWAAIAIGGVAAAFVSALAPEIEYDALWYHLELPRRWLAAGRPVDDVTEYISLYPLTWQLLYGGALALDGASAARLLHWTALVASAVVAAAIGGRALGVASPWLVAAIFVTAPTVLWEATAAYTDLAVALHVGIGAGALWAASVESDRRWTWLAAVQLGLACATKHLALVPAAIALAFFGAHLLRARRTPRAVASWVQVAAVILVLASPWYLRSWLASGNPVFPELYGVFGAQPPERWDALTERGLAGFKSRFGGERRPGDLVTLPWDMTMHGARFGGTLGPLLLMFVPCLVPLWKRSSAGRWLIAGLVLYVAAWASPVSSLQLRFLVPWWLFAAPVVAWAAGQLLASAARTSRRARMAAAALLAGALVLNLPPFTPLHEGDRAGWTGWLTHVVRRVPIEVVAGGIDRGRYLREEVRTFGAWAFLNDRAEADARVLTFFGGDHFYARRARLWSEAVVARPVTWGSVGAVDGSLLLARLRALRITHVMAPPAHLRTPDMAVLSLLQPAFAASALDVEYGDAWVVVYRVRSAPAPALARRTTDQR